MQVLAKTTSLIAFNKSLRSLQSAASIISSKIIKSLKPVQEAARVKVFKSKIRNLLDSMEE